MDAEKTAITARPAQRPRWRVGDELALLQLIVVAMIAGTLLHPAFLTPINIVNVLQQSSELSVLVLAEAIILIVGRFDLSLESIVGVAPMFAAWLVLDKTPPPELAANQERYLEDQKRSKEQAQEFEKKRDEQSKEADELPRGGRPTPAQ